LYVLGAAFTAAVVGVVILIAVTTSGGEGGVPGGPIVVPDPRPSDVPQEGHVYGDPDAPVTIDEYLDYQCPFCRLATVEILPAIEEQYIETGMAKLVIHPIAIIGEESVQAGAAAECANGTGDFLLYHDALFANQGGENAGAFSDERLEAIAVAVGLDGGAIRSCLDAETYQASVRQNTVAAGNAGIRSTPTFLVNGARVETNAGAISAAIEAAAGS
jgi:protein-disulfide isomerase